MTTDARFLFPPTSIAIPEHRIFGILGASGAGKSTFLKCLNWLIDLTPNLRIEGDVLWHSRSIFTPMTDIDALRARIGMIFQQPVVFPKSILDNVLFGVRHLRRIAAGEKLGLAETALREAALWNRFGLRLITSGILVALGATVWQFSHLTGNVAFIFGLSKENTSVPGANGFTLAGALRSPAFWAFAGAGAAFNMVSSGLGLFNESVLNERGFDQKTFHDFLVFTTLISLGGQFGCGWLSRRCSYQMLTCVALILYGLGLGLIPVVSRHWQLWALSWIFRAF